MDKSENPEEALCDVCDRDVPPRLAHISPSHRKGQHRQKTIYRSGVCVGVCTEWATLLTHSPPGSETLSGLLFPSQHAVGGSSGMA